VFLTFFICPLCAFAGLFRNGSFFGWFQINTRAPGFRQTNSNGLPGRSCAMFAFSDLLYFIVHKLARLCAG
jgi:hypothetical protein